MQHRSATRGGASWTAAIGACLLFACSDDTAEGPAQDAADSEVDELDEVDATDDSETGPDAPDDTEDADAHDDPEADSESETDLADVDDPCPDWWEAISPTAGEALGDGPDPDASFGGGARAGRVRTGPGPFTSPDGACRRGDFVVENEHLVVCIANEDSMTPMLFDGGNIVDIERRDSPGRDELHYMIPANGLQNQGADRVELIADGADGESAVVRVTGPDVLTMFGAATIGNIIPPLGLHFVTEYRLAPGSRALELVTWVSRRTEVDAPIRIGDLVGGGDTTRSWYERFGFAAPPLPTATPLFASIGARHSIGVWAPALAASQLSLPEVDVPFGNLHVASGRLCAGDTAVYRRWVVAGFGGTWELRDQLAGVMPERDGAPLTLRTDEPDGRQWELLDAAGASVDVVVVQGATSGSLPAGAYTARPLSWPTAPAPSVAFTVPAEGPVALPSPELGRVDVEVTLVDGEAEVAGPAEAVFVGPVTRTFVSTPDARTVALPPGTYDVWVSRGIEYGYWQGTVVVETDEVATVAARVVRELDTRGWVGGDMHQHAAPSPDSVTSVVDRVLANAGAGVDFVSPSDHDAVGDFGTVIDALGLDRWLHLLQGEELSPGQGHINLFPRTYDRDAPNAGAIPLGRRTPGSSEFTIPTSAEYIEAARADGVELVMINHPRGPLAHFSGVRYDPVLGPDANEAVNWFDDFDAIEVYNLPGRFCTGLQDWFSLLSHGRLVTGVGNSDTHELDEPSGWPRNYLRSVTDEASELDDAGLLASLLAGRVTVSGGLFVELGEGLVPGETLPLVEGVARLPVRVSAASWVPIEFVALYVNGVELERRAAFWPESGPRTIELEFAVDAEQDAHVVVVAWSSSPMPVVYPGKRPFGFTNPVFVDLDGDGWDAPGVAGPEAAPIPLGLPSCN